MATESSFYQIVLDAVLEKAQHSPLLATAGQMAAEMGKIKFDGRLEDVDLKMAGEALLAVFAIPVTTGFFGALGGIGIGGGRRGAVRGFGYGFVGGLLVDAIALYSEIN